VLVVGAVGLWLAAWSLRPRRRLALAQQREWEPDSWMHMAGRGADRWAWNRSAESRCCAACHLNPALTTAFAPAGIEDVARAKLRTVAYRAAITAVRLFGLHAMPSAHAGGAGVALGDGPCRAVERRSPLELEGLGAAQSVLAQPDGVGGLGRVAGCGRHRPGERGVPRQPAGSL